MPNNESISNVKRLLFSNADSILAKRLMPITSQNNNSIIIDKSKLLPSQQKKTTIFS